MQLDAKARAEQLCVTETEMTLQASKPTTADVSAHAAPIAVVVPVTPGVVPVVLSLIVPGLTSLGATAR